MRRLSPYKRLVLECAAPVTPLAQSRIAALLETPDLDWPAVVRTSIQHGVAQNMALHLRAFPHHLGLPAEIRACLERIYCATHERNWVMLREASRIVRTLGEAQIPCLVLKGTGLACTVYPELALRNFADIDILVQEADFERAGEILTARGYTPPPEGIAPDECHLSYVTQVEEDILTATLAPEYDPTHAHPRIARVAQRVTVELHHHLLRRAGGSAREADLTPFWETAQVAAFPDGTAFSLPGPEAMLVHLASHAGRHTYGRLLFPMDIAQMVRFYGGRWDWKRIEGYAKQYGACHDLFRLLEFAQREWGVAIPTDSLQRLQAAAGALGTPLSPAQIFDAMRLVTQEHSAETWLRLRQGQSLRENLASATRILFPTPERMRRLYGLRSSLALAIWYPLRPLLLMGRLARILWRTQR